MYVALPSILSMVAPTYSNPLVRKTY